MIYTLGIHTCSLGKDKDSVVNRRKKQGKRAKQNKAKRVYLAPNKYSKDE